MTGGGVITLRCPPIPPDVWPSIRSTYFPKVENPPQVDETVARAGGLVIDGMPTRGYAITFTAQVQGKSTTTNEKLYVGVQTGLPRRGVMESGGTMSTLDYYDYGAKITVALPACS